jgi:dipeptidyl aminopeptidase/acylaminoacyl peptidase
MYLLIWPTGGAMPNVRMPGAEGRKPSGFRLRAIAVLLAVATLGDAPAFAQTTAFTAEDMLDVTTLAILDLSEDGRFVAVTTRRLRDNATTDHRRFGDPSYVAPAALDLLVIDTTDGDIQRPFDGLRHVRQAAFSRDAGRLAILTASEDDEGLPRTAVHVWDTTRRTLGEVRVRGDAQVSASSDLVWRPDGSALIVTLRTPAQEREAQQAFRTQVDGPVVVHRSEEPFLEWDTLRREDRRRRLAALDPRTGAVTDLLPETALTSYRLARDGESITFLEDATERTDYDVIFGTHNAVKHLPLDTPGAAPRTVVDAATLKTTVPRWSDDGRILAWADRGEVFVQSVHDERPRSVTPKPQDASESSPPAGGADQARSESFAVSAFSRDAARLLVTSPKGWYVVTLADASRELVLPLDDTNPDRNPRLAFLDWSPDGRGLLIQYGEPDRWERGIVRLDVQTKQITPLVKDTHLYSTIRLSRDATTFVFQRSDGDRPADLYVADASFSNVRRLTEMNPWMADRALPRSELVSYRDVDGKVLYGVLRYPVDYEEGRTYPTILEIYETFFDNGFNARAAFLANHGYAVFHPSVNLVIGRPGEAWVKGVTTAANRLIELGVADPDRLGVHGTSYGGYATVLLLTETDRFKAAINISGKVNMISFYTDSPRLGVRNTHAAEKSQDRIGGTLWEYPERYLAHSAIMRADRITTPLLNITGDQDPNVPASQSREIYYALRRLGKTVEWVRYVDGGHRPPNTAEESVDFERRILAWYHRYLKAAETVQTQ